MIIQISSSNFAFFLNMFNGDTETDGGFLIYPGPLRKHWDGGLSHKQITGENWAEHIRVSLLRYIIYWLVVWNRTFFIFPNSWDDDPI